MGKQSEAAYNDSAFLYLIFTGLVLVNLYLAVSLACRFLGKFPQHSSPGSLKSVLVRGSLLFLLGFWTWQVYTLIQEDAANEALGSFDPWEILGVPSGTFNTPEIKKAYRKASTKLHPDKNLGHTD